MKEKISDFPWEQGYEMQDYGCFSEEAVGYPHVAVEVAEMPEYRRSLRAMVLVD